MDWLDLFIILFLLAALIRGSEVGFIRQFFSTVGLLIGLFLGAWSYWLLSGFVTTAGTRALVALLVVSVFGLAVMGIGEFVGAVIKLRLRHAQLTNKFDRFFGSVLAVVTLLAVVWLGASIFRNIPDSGWQRQIRNSRVVNLLDSNLPPAPGLLTTLGHLIDPNNFPQVFIGREPGLKTDAPLPDLGELNTAIKQARPSVVKVEGEGCNNLVEGSGFVAGDGAVVTNAHVVAGVRHPFVLDQKGRHGARVVLFDPDLDIAILRADNLVGKPLTPDTKEVPSNTPVAILGYPSGSGFTARPGLILETFVAEGRNIYNHGFTLRKVYSIQANVVQGNSGGPVIDKNGSVIGVIFAKSINYDQVGYAITMEQVMKDIERARGASASVSTESCAT